MNVYRMILAIFLAVFSMGHLREVFAKSLMMPNSVELIPVSKLENRKYRAEERKRLENIISYLTDNQEHVMNFRAQEVNANRIADSIEAKTALNNIKDEIEQSIILVKTKRTRQRGKRFIQQRARMYNLTPCLFKICNMGRKRVM